eukprot:gene8200-biopygen22605
MRILHSHSRQNVTIPVFKTSYCIRQSSKYCASSTRTPFPQLAQHRRPRLALRWRWEIEYAKRFFARTELRFLVTPKLYWSRWCSVLVSLV